jgi:asparagine synthase (glutamine-hydrolysing)
MCGIAGFQGTFDPDLLSACADALGHRGPDGSGTWYSPRARTGLAHRRLSILDLSALGHQPMGSRLSGATIVFNGEIYNFRELRHDLERRGHLFRSYSDTEVLLALYEAKDEAMLSLLNGIFAFAIWDDATQSLFIAGDAMGVKPLYFAQTADGFLLASELKALLRTGTIPATLDVAAIFRTLGYLWSPGGATPFRGVRRLGPGQALRVKDGRIVRHRGSRRRRTHRRHGVRLAPADHRRRQPHCRPRWPVPCRYSIGRGTHTRRHQSRRATRHQ